MSGPAFLEVLEPGLASALQDLGRRGLQRFGVPPAGALDREGLALANALVGAPPDQAALEIRVLGPRLRYQGPAPRRAALAGADAAATILRDGDETALAPWRSVALAPGDVLKIGALKGGATAYLAVEGGFDAAPVLGARASFARSRLGGFTGDGAAIAVGQRLALAPAPPPQGAERALPQPPRPEADPATIRVVLGPQDDHFDAATIATFLSAEWRVSQAADRMGMRLEGPVLTHAKRADIVSDGIVSGAIQVPASGQPILLMVDRQTAGGYAKIAAAISADLPRIGRLGPGARLRFEAVSASEGARLRRAAEATLAARLAAIAPIPGEGLDLDALYRANLISGVVGPEGTP